MLNEFKQDSLRDLITKSRKGSNSSSLMNKALNDIKKELVSADRNVKIHAVQKLIFFYLNHYDVKWASFHTLEILATCGAQGKRFGYMIGQIQYKGNPEYLQLIPQMIRKELTSQNLNYINSALNFVNQVMDLQLANEISKDLEKLMNINNNLIRKKLILSLTKACERFLTNEKNFMYNYWDDLIVKYISILNNIKELTNGVSICIISSIQKICKKNPGKCIAAFVELMNYFTKCEINWNLIKIVDIFGMLFAYESKFTKKKEFVKIIADQLAKTKSKSVEVQLVRLVISHFDSNTSSATMELFQNCEERLKNLLFFNDNNLVIISLRICKELFKKNKIVSANYLNDILKILDANSKNGNANIQTECLEIINLSVSNDNYKKIVEHLFSLREFLGTKVIDTILEICTYDTYSRLQSKENFLWFLEILFSLAETEFGKESELSISYIIRDLGQRIEILREIIDNNSFKLINQLIIKMNEQMNEQNNYKKRIISIGESDFFTENVRTKSPDTLITVLSFCIGEYTDNEVEKRIESLLSYLTASKSARENYFIPITNSIMKLMFKSYSLSGNVNLDFVEILDKLVDYHSNFGDLEMLEMNIVIRNIMKVLRTGGLDKEQAASFFASEIMPTHEKAQMMVAKPKDVDISICFSLNDEELIVGNTSGEKGKERGKGNDIVKSDSSQGEEEVKTFINNDAVVINKKIYAPESDQ